MVVDGRIRLGDGVPDDVLVRLNADDAGGGDAAAAAGAESLPRARIAVAGERARARLDARPRRARRAGSRSPALGGAPPRWSPLDRPRDGGTGASGRGVAGGGFAVRVGNPDVVTDYGVAVGPPNPSLRYAT